MEKIFLNKNRNRYYGHRVGDMVDTGHNGMGIAKVVQLGSMDNNSIYVNYNDITAKVVAEWCKTISRVEDSQIRIDSDILERAISIWGQDAQIKMVREECLELAIEIGKFYDRDGSRERYDKIIDEIADVTIMSRQMEQIPGMKDEIQKRVDFKMDRLEDRLNKKQF